jgi:hypothetical protein
LYPQTVVGVLHNKYKVVLCLDISTSVASVVDGEVLLNRLYSALQESVFQLTDPLTFGNLVIKPEVYLSVIAQGRQHLLFYSNKQVLQRDLSYMALW